MLHSPLAIGNVFRRIRKRHLDKPSLRDAAKVIGVTHQTLGSLENGSSNAWTKERIEKLCQFYGVAIEDFNEMCKAEDERLDRPDRSIHDTDADPDEVARYKRYMANLSPKNQKIQQLQQRLSDELAPKDYLEELTAIAKRYGIEH